MAEGQKPFWIGVVAGAVIVIAVAPFAVVFWKNATSERARIQIELTELNSKFKKTNDTLAQVQKTVSLERITKELELLNSKIKSTNEALAGSQKASLESIVEKLELLDAKAKSTNDALADIKKTGSPGNVAEELGQLSSKIKNSNDALAEIQKASLSTSRAQSDRSAKLENAIDALKKEIDDDSAMRAKLSQEIAKLQDALKSGAAPSAGSKDVVVFYVHTQDATQKAQFAAIAPPMTIRFEKVGSLDDNGQAEMIIHKLKGIIKNESNCSISVAGYADTLGGDKTNLTISKKRAQAIAAKLKSAFAGNHVQISEAAWGERRLQDWTPNDVGHEANRRVEIAVSCKPK
jgi:outer membrane protein OmpA-like peptidoglycan-associated protein